jgi:cell division transport system permease protein
MNILFFIKEGFIGLKRARLSAVISVVSLCLALTLIGIFGLTTLNLKDIVYRFYKEIEIEVFLDPTISGQQVSSLQKKIEELPQIRTVTYISREQALQEFQEIFGEDIQKVLKENPLPPSFRIILKPEFSTPDGVEALSRDISKLNGVQDIIYQKEIIKFLHKYLTLGITLAAFVTFSLLIVITILVINTIRLTIYARRTIIQIMKLVGATNYFIKGPFVFEGIFQGALGGLLSSGLIWIISQGVRQIIFPELVIQNYVYLFLIAGGIFLGLVGSYLSINKYLHY